MAIEQTVIVDKLKEEGINETLGNGLSFETDADLGVWVEAYKSGLPAQKKDLTEYTKEELEEIAKDPQFKGAKGLQGLLDSIRQKKAEPIKKDDPKTDDSIALALKELKDQLSELKGQKAIESFDALVSKVGKSESLSDVHINRVKKGLKSDATEADIKAEIVAYKKELASIGVKEFGTPGSGNSNVYKPSESLSAKYAARHKKKQETKK